MILTAHQPSYLPWLGLFHKIALADKFVLFDQVQYVPKDWISRNVVKGPNGPILLTVPVLRKDYLGKKIVDIEIKNDLPWAKKHWMSIAQAYQKAPHFKRYAGFFEDVYKREWKLLADLDWHMLRWFVDTLGISTELSRAGEYNFSGTKSDLVLDMCVQMKADVYIFGIQGADYADRDMFASAGVTPYFQSYAHPVYRQNFGEFAPNMSVVDLLFNLGPDALDVIMSGNAAPEEIRKLQKA